MLCNTRYSDSVNVNVDVDAEETTVCVKGANVATVMLVSIGDGVRE